MLKTIKLDKKNKFHLYGLDDDCFIIVDSIDINDDISVPIVLHGSVYQIDSETNNVNKLGDDYNIQISMTMDAMWRDSND